GEQVWIALDGVDEGGDLRIAQFPGAATVDVLAKPGQALETIGPQRVQSARVSAIGDGIEAGAGHVAEVRPAEPKEPRGEEASRRRNGARSWRRGWGWGGRRRRSRRWSGRGVRRWGNRRGGARGGPGGREGVGGSGGGRRTGGRHRGHAEHGRDGGAARATGSGGTRA